MSKGAPKTLRMLGGSPDAAGRRLDDHRYSHFTTRHVRDLRHRIIDLLETGTDEIHEHDLDDWPVPRHCQSHAHAGEGHLSDRRIPDPILTELINQPIGRAEYAAVRGDVLPQNKHTLIGLHFQSDRFFNGPGYG